MRVDRYARIGPIVLMRDEVDGAHRERVNERGALDGGGSQSQLACNPE